MNSDFTTYTKINLKWTKDLNIKSKITKHQKKKNGEKVHYCGWAKSFLVACREHKPFFKKFIKSDFIKIGNICSSEGSKKASYQIECL